MADDDDRELSLVEPYRVKVIETIRLPSREERRAVLARAFYSIPYVDADDVFIDLVTDSGTGAMSDEQWAGLMRGDESYVRSRSFFRFEKAVQGVTGYPYVLPTHQGRAAENILMELLVKPGDVVPSNAFYDTTRAHVENRQATPLDLVGDSSWDFASPEPFKGNFDLEKLEAVLARYRGRVPFVLITIVNNFACSSPVSMENIREVKRLADGLSVPVLFDACRFAENAYFIKRRGEGFADKTVGEIALEVFSYGQGCFVSAKKDALANIGGFIALRDEELAQKCRERLVLYEGFPTYGGLAGRDLEAIAIGLKEGLEEEHLRYRTNQVARLGELLDQVGVLVSKPVGGSGVFVDVDSIYPHLSAERLPDITFCCELYLEGAVRAGPMTSTINGVDPRTGAVVPRSHRLARFAVPRRVYSEAQLKYVAEVVRRVKAKAHLSQGYRLVYAPKTLGHFFSKYQPRDD